MSEVSIKHFDDKYLEQTEDLIKDYPEIFSSEEYKFFRDDLLHNLLEKFYHKKTSWSLLICTPNEVYGVVFITKPKDSKSYFKINWLIVNKEKQGKGYGTKLIKEAFKLIKDLGGSYAYLETSYEKYNEPAKKFYDHLGMKEMAVLPNFYDPPAHERHRPEDCVMFFKEL